MLVEMYKCTDIYVYYSNKKDRHLDDVIMFILHYCGQTMLLV